MKFFQTHLKRSLLLGGLAAATVSSSEAVTLSQWTFNSTTTAPSGVAAGVTAGDFIASSAFAGTVGPNTTVLGVGSTTPFVFPVANTAGGYNLTASEAGAITATHTFTFTIAPTSGNSLNLNSLSFYAWSNANKVDTVAYNFFVRSSADPSVTLGTFTSVLETASAPGAASQFQLNLSSVAGLQNVQSTTTFTIGVYMSEPTSTGNLRVDSVLLDGTVGAIPEPSSLLISGLGLGLLTVRRRVRRI